MYLFSLIGAPGSGKSSIGRKLAESEGVYHLSIGDHLRARREAGDFDTQAEILEALDHGRLLDNKVIVPLVVAEVQKYVELGAIALFIDGFPRRVDQAQEFETLHQRFDLVVCLACPEDVAKERYLGRRHPQRLGDNEELFDSRMREYLAQRDFLKERYAGAGRWEEVVSINNIKETLKALLAAMDNWSFIIGLESSSIDRIRH